jgi:glycosyltransferase involved in cell wall biosynthesis
VSDLHKIVVLIPAWRPEPQLVEIVSALVVEGAGAVILVDDGNDGDALTIMLQAAAVPRVMVVRHATNRGKGRALKSGIALFLEQFPDFSGIVTADADGQHTVCDILAVARELRDRNVVVLGSRTFSADVPLRSRFGNVLTRKVFGLATGVKLSDTQTGLRGIPASRLREILLLEGERYEYEMTVLAHLCRQGLRPIEVPIETVYIDNNRSSHFDPVRDSMRIYYVLLRFYFSSLVAAAIDIAGFSIMFLLTKNIAASVAFGRLSSLVNFALNRRFVFHQRGGLGGELWRYYLLAISLGGLSYLLIVLLTTHLRWNVLAAKISVDVLLSVASFVVQRSFVFGKARKG